MLSISKYKEIYANQNTLGKVRIADSNTIVEATWDGDIQSCVGYLYDYYHDNEPKKYRNMSPSDDEDKIAVDIKFIVSTYNSLDKDQVGFKIQFRPSHTNPLEYFKADYEDKYGVEYPVGLYMDIPDKKGEYQRWLICAKGNTYEQFDTWYVLPCDHLFQWCKNGKKYEIWGVSRSQNSLREINLTVRYMVKAM